MKELSRLLLFPISSDFYFIKEHQESKTLLAASQAQPAPLCKLEANFLFQCEAVSQSLWVAAFPTHCHDTSLSAKSRWTLNLKTGLEVGGGTGPLKDVSLLYFQRNTCFRKQRCSMQKEVRRLRARIEDISFKYIFYFRVFFTRLCSKKIWAHSIPSKYTKKLSWQSSRIQGTLSAA